MCFLLPVLRAAAAALRKIGLAAAAPVKNFVCFFAVFAAVGVNAGRMAGLGVYPAAGLLYYAPQGIPVYVVDPHIPSEARRLGFHLIEKGASEGVKELTKRLMMNH